MWTGRSIVVAPGGMTSGVGETPATLVGIFRLETSYLGANIIARVKLDGGIVSAPASFVFRVGESGQQVFSIGLSEEDSNTTGLSFEAPASGFPSGRDIYVYFTSEADRDAGASGLTLLLYSGMGGADVWGPPMLGRPVGGGDRGLYAAKRWTASSTRGLPATPDLTALPDADFSWGNLLGGFERIPAYTAGAGAIPSSGDWQTPTNLIPWKASPAKMTGDFSFYGEAAVFPLPEPWEEPDAGGVTPWEDFVKIIAATPSKWAFALFEKDGEMVPGSYSELFGNRPALFRTGACLLNSSAEIVPKFIRLEGEGGLALYSLGVKTLATGSTSAPLLTTFGEFSVSANGVSYGTSSSTIATVEGPQLSSITKAADFKGVLRRSTGAGAVTATLKDSAGSTLGAVSSSSDTSELKEAAFSLLTPLDPSPYSRTESMSVTLVADNSTTNGSLTAAALELFQGHDQLAKGTTTISSWSLADRGKYSDLISEFELSRARTSDLTSAFALSAELSLSVESRWRLDAERSSDLLATWELSS